MIRAWRYVGGVAEPEPVPVDALSHSVDLGVVLTLVLYWWFRRKDWL